MNRKQKILLIQRHLLDWFRKNGREFPWRGKSMTLYEYVIAETLLQRTKAETIALFYPKFLRNYPTWESLSSAKIEILEDFLKPIGLNRQRASRLKRLADEMISLDGKLPEERKELEKISFFGQYMVNAIQLFIFHQSTPLLDVNMARILERIFKKRKLADIRYDKNLQKLAYDIINHNNAKELNWAFLDYASLVCKPKPRCFECELKSICTYYGCSVKTLAS